MVRGRVVEVTTEDADRFRDPAEVRMTLKILPAKANEGGLEE